MKNQEIDIRYHASSAKRWFNCFKSLELSAMLPPSEPTKFAAEGTVAHTISENLIEDIINSFGIKSPQQVIEEYRSKIMGDINPLKRIVIEQGFQIEITDEMLSAVEEYIMYIDKVLSINETSWKSVIVEKKVSILKKTNFNVKLDAYFITDNPFIKQAHIFDLKYGKGEYVSMGDNHQLQIYAIGINDMYPDLSETCVHIVQPRIKNTQTCRYDKYTNSEVKDLKKFLQKKLKSIKENPELTKQGDWCKYCPAKNQCPLLTKVMANPELLNLDLKSPEEYANAWETCLGLEKQLKTVKEKIMAYATNGGEVTGYEIVNGRSTRQWKNASEAEQTLVMLHGEKVFEEKCLKSPATLEKELGASAIADLIVNVSTTKTLKKLSEEKSELLKQLENLN